MCLGVLNVVFENNLNKRDAEPNLNEEHRRGSLKLDGFQYRQNLPASLLVSAVFDGLSTFADLTILRDGSKIQRSDLVDVAEYGGALRPKFIKCVGFVGMNYIQQCLLL
jgi:hypothetical protein